MQQFAEEGKEAINITAKETTADLLRNAKFTNDGKIYVDAQTLNKIGAIEARGGKAFSGLTKIVINSKAATWHGQKTGGIEQVVEYRDGGVLKFLIHEVTDGAGNVVHRDFDAVRIASGQAINKQK